MRNNGYWLRGMTDEELAGFLARFADADDHIHYCRELPECLRALDTDEPIPLERCQRCLLEWLRKEHEHGPE